VSIETGGSQPRKDLVWIDSAGTLQVERGTPTAPKPQAFTRFRTQVPPVPFPSTTPATVLAAVYVAGNATAVSGQDLQDRRVTSEAVKSAVSTDEVRNEVSAIAVYDYEIDDSSSRQLDPDAAIRPALYTIYANNGTAGMIAVDDVGQESVSLISTDGIGTTQGGSSSLNVYWTGSRIEIQNTESFSFKLSITRMGFRNSGPSP